MLGTYFFYTDKNAHERQSHGVYFVKDIKTNLLLLFCAEQEIFWKNISDNGELMNMLPVRKPELIALNLLEIQQLGYLIYVSGVTKITSTNRQSIAF
jgi:hypothetical protein